MKIYTEEDIKKALGSEANHLLLILNQIDNYKDIISWEKVCEKVGKCDLNFFEDEDIIAYKKMKHITKAINPPGWKAKFDCKQKSWYIFWSVLPSGSCFSDSHYTYGRTYTAVGSHLYFESKERAMHFIKYFSETAKPFYLP